MFKKFSSTLDRHNISLLSICFWNSWKRKKIQFTKTNISEKQNENGIKTDILKEEIQSRMGGKKPITTVVNLLKKAIPPHLRTPRGAPQK